MGKVRHHRTPKSERIGDRLILNPINLPFWPVCRNIPVYCKVTYLKHTMCKNMFQKIHIILDLIKINDDPEDIADDKDNHDPDKYHGNVLVAPLPVAGPLVGGSALGDGLIEHGIDHCEDEEGDERHNDEVSQENVVTGVAWVISHLCRTY